MSTSRQFILGIFFLTALSVLGFYTLFLTDFTLFKDPVMMRVYFAEAHDLREGNPVMVSGLRIGSVKGLEYDQRAPRNRRIRATLALNSPLEMPVGTTILIEESTFLGGRHVNIEPGEYGGGAMPKTEDGAYEGAVRQNPLAALGSIGTLLGENREAIGSILDNVSAITADARAGKGLVGMLLNDQRVAQDVADSVSDLRLITTEAKGIADDIRQGRGVLGKLINDPELVASLTGAMDSLQVIIEDVRAGRGVVGKLVADDELAAEISSLIQNFGELGENLNSGKGTLGKFLSDERFAADVEVLVQSLKTASLDIQEVTKTVRNGEGSLGKLLMNQELYDEVLVSVKLLSRSLEDYREAAPITAFTGVLFSAF